MKKESSRINNQRISLPNQNDSMTITRTNFTKNMQNSEKNSLSPVKPFVHSGTKAYLGSEEYTESGKNYEY